MIGSVVLTGLSGTGDNTPKYSTMTTAMKTHRNSRNLPCVNEVGLAGFVDQLGNFPHRAVHRQILQPAVNDQAEHQSEDAKQNSDQSAVCGRRSPGSEPAKDREASGWPRLRRFPEPLGQRGGAQQCQGGAYCAYFHKSASKRAICPRARYASVILHQEFSFRVTTFPHIDFRHTSSPWRFSFRAPRVWLTGISYRPPLQDWIGVLRLTAANELCPGVTAGKDTHDPHTGYNKAYFYNMLGEDGQTVLHLGW